MGPDAITTHVIGIRRLTIVDDAKGAGARVQLEVYEALELANRLQRAASLVFEFQEDNPDIEREAARFTVMEGGEDNVPIPL